MTTAPPLTETDSDGRDEAREAEERVEATATEREMDAVLGLERLSDVLCADSPLSFAEVAPLASNVRAIETALEFVAGERTSSAIFGPSGWGKSRLLSAAAAIAGRISGAPVPLCSADMAESEIARLDAPEILVLDDAESVALQPRRRLALRRALESRHRRRRPTLLAFTAADPRGGRGVRDLLPSARGWNIALVAEPTREERRDLLHHLAAREDLRLGETLATVVAREMAGNGRTLVGALRRLRLHGRDWTGSAAALHGLGLLDPFFADSPAWDLRHRIARAAEGARARFAAVAPFDLSCYTMLAVAGLAERGVADYFGREPAEAYLAASRFRRAMERDPAVAASVEAFVDLIVRELA